MTSSTQPTGYGPRHRLMFDGDERKYELWEVKFLGYLRTKMLHETITQEDEEIDEDPDPIPQFPPTGR